jgi:hypothetical protein
VVVTGVDDHGPPAVVSPTAASSLLRSGRLVLLIALLTAAGGLIGSLLRGTGAAVYEGEAVVAASDTTLPPDNFSDLGIALFRTDTVLGPVTDEVNLDVAPQSLLSEGYLEVEAISNAVAVHIVAHHSDPQVATTLANAAAESFSSALTDSEMGTFAVFNDEEVSRISGPSALQSALLAGALGVVLGATLLLLRTVVVQPILSQEEALRIYPADVAFSARVRTEGASPFRSDSSEKDQQVFPRGLASAIRRSTEGRPGVESLDSYYVLVERSRRGDRSVRALLDELRAGRSERIDDVHKRDLKYVTALDRRLGQLIEDAGIIVALVSQGVSRRSLQSLTEELLVAPGRRLLVLVFVGTIRRGPTLSGAWARLRQLLTRWWSSMRRQFSGSGSGGT